MDYRREQKASCPHCGNMTIFEILIMAETPEQVQMEPDDPESIQIFDGYNFLGKCKTCEQLVLFYTWEHDEIPNSITYANTLYPNKKILPTVVPENVRLVYDEAVKIKKISPTMFVVAIRKALELVCIDKGATGHTLNDKIQNLGQKNIIPEQLTRMANALRLFGNLGAHGVPESVTTDETSLIDEFYNTIVEYVYIAPDKLNRLAEQYKNRFK